ncbi:non-homologous end-joining DNA ligase [Paenibacillus sp. N1-5-1-14]|uniref:non-homologous end-joining DNA ligase n=1 Tax=Paenibacillus radicibacter TaxID=2972488 RepID=UPI00215928D2|nr:non-homologous end-joining DNA ligase [Paenibacillus radicibacter]MCR8643576.1 non-homologous end-joining DNA ligase [Paenibacillus radicibacter]
MANQTGTFEVAGHTLTLSNPNKMLWSEVGITKLIYMQKLLEIAPYLLTYCRNRYLTTIRYPHGITDKSFYQKNAPEPLPDFVKTSVLHDIQYVNLDSIPTLLWLGNLACLEFHPSFQHIGSSAPAEWVIDLDPSQEEEPRIMQAAALIGQILQSLNIQSIPKTSGATGVQIYIPIKDGYSFEQLRSIGHFIGKFASEQHPDLFTIERFKKNRGNRIYVDYLQHWLGKTLSAPYTPRAKKYATVSTPLTWEEVNQGSEIRDFNLLTIGERLLTHGDLIAKVAPQNLEAVLKHLQ